MPSKTIIVIAIAAMIFLSCDSAHPYPNGCCDNPPINEPVGNGHVYVPNIFTPDNDGRNDLLSIYSDSYIKLIRSMQVTSTDNAVVFFQIDFPPGNSAYGWDGRVNGKLKPGVFNVLFEIEAIDGTVKTVEGKVCNYSCAENQTDKLSLDKCRFPEQNDNGHLNPTIAVGEVDGCFE